MARSLSDWVNHIKEYRSEGEAPAGFELDLFRIGFADLYFTEEFDRLARGLSRLLARGPISERRTKSTEGWIRQAGDRSGGSLNAGSFDLRQLPRRLRPTSFTEVGVWLIQLNPSLIVASFVVTPSPWVVDAFRRIFREPSGLDAYVSTISWRLRFVGGGIRAGHLVRRRERDELLLSPNAELTRLLRHYIGAGQAMIAPLASTDVLTTERPLAETLAAPPQGTVAEKPREWSIPMYLMSLGREPLAGGISERLARFCAGRTR